MAKRIKTGGRVQGTPNLLTKEMREILNNVISKEIEELQETLSKLEPAKRLELVVKLLPFVIPRMNDIDLTVKEPEIMQPMTIIYKGEVLDIKK